MYLLNEIVEIEYLINKQITIEYVIITFWRLRSAMNELLFQFQGCLTQPLLFHSFVGSREGQDCQDMYLYSNV